MGETQTRSLALGRIAALAFGCAAVLGSQGAAAQARSPAGDKAGAQGLAGSIVQYEEGAGRAILYHEAQGGLVNGTTAPVVRANGSPAGAPKAAAKAAPAKGPAAEPASTNGAIPLRAPQRKAAPAEGVAMRP